MKISNQFQNPNYKIIWSLAILSFILISFIFISPVLAQSSLDRSQRPSTPKSRAYLGVIKSVNGNSIFIALKDGNREIRVSDQILILRAEKKEIVGFSELKVGDFIVAMGQVNGNVMDAKLIMLTPSKKPELRRHAVGGIVQSISGQTLTLKHSKQDKTYQVVVGVETKIKIKGLEFPSFPDIKIGDRVVATGTLENEVLTAKHLFVIPGKTTGLEKPPTSTRLPKFSTPSAR